MNKREIRQNKVNEIAKLLNHEGGTIIKHACTGKYRGYNDYSIKFNSGDELYLTMVAKNIDTELDYIISKINYFNDNKEYIIQYNKAFNIFDNKLASEKNLKPYKLIDIKIANSNSHVLWAYAVVEIDNKLRGIIETGFSFETFKINKDTVFEGSKHKYFVAGGLQEKDVNFIWHNVGMSTTNELYNYELKY